MKRYTLSLCAVLSTAAIAIASCSAPTEEEKDSLHSHDHAHSKAEHAHEHDHDHDHAPKAKKAAAKKTADEAPVDDAAAAPVEGEAEVKPAKKPAAKKKAWSDLLTLTERLDRPDRPQ